MNGQLSIYLQIAFHIQFSAHQQLASCVHAVCCDINAQSRCIQLSHRITTAAYDPGLCGVGPEIYACERGFVRFKAGGSTGIGSSRDVPCRRKIILIDIVAGRSRYIESGASAVKSNALRSSILCCQTKHLSMCVGKKISRLAQCKFIYFVVAAATYIDAR